MNKQEEQLYFIHSELEEVGKAFSALPESIGEIVDVVKDSQEKLKGKLDAPETAGTEDQILSINASGEPVWVDAVEGSIVADEMSDNSTQPVQNKVIKAYVDSATAAEERVTKGTLPVTFEKGNIKPDGTDDTSNNRVRTIGFIPACRWKLICKTGFVGKRCVWYNADGTKYSADNILVNPYVNAIPTLRARFTIGKTDDSSMAVTDNFFDSLTDLGALVPSVQAIKTALSGLSFWQGTQDEYDELGTYDPNTVYLIIE